MEWLESFFGKGVLGRGVLYFAALGVMAFVAVYTYTTNEWERWKR